MDKPPLPIPFIAAVIQDSLTGELDLLFAKLPISHCYKKCVSLMTIYTSALAFLLTMAKPSTKMPGSR